MEKHERFIQRRRTVGRMAIGALGVLVGVFGQATVAAAANGQVPVITSVSPVIAQNGTVTCAVTVCVTGAAVVINGSGFGDTPPVVAKSAIIGGAPLGSNAVGVQALTKNLEISATTPGRFFGTTTSFMGKSGVTHGGFDDCFVTIGAWSDKRIIVLLDDTGTERSLGRCRELNVNDPLTVQVWNTDDDTASRVFQAGKTMAMGTTAKIDKLTPASGPVTGGTFAPGGEKNPAGTITIEGTGFSGASVVWFGNGGAPGAAVAVTEFTVNQDGTSITVVPPPSPLAGDRGIFIAITTPAGTSSVQCNTIIQGCAGTYYYQSPSNVIPEINGSTGPLDLSFELSKEIPIATPGACPSTSPLPASGIKIAASAKAKGGPVSFKGTAQTSTNLGLLSSVQAPITVTVENPVEIAVEITGQIAGCFAVPIPGLSIAGLGGVYVLIGGSLEVGYTLTITLNKGTFVVNIGYVANELAGVSIPAEGQKCVDAAGAAAPCLQTRSSGFLAGTLFVSPLWIQLNIGVGPAKIEAGAGLIVGGTVRLSTDTGFDFDVCLSGNYSASVTLGPKTFSTAGVIFGPFNIYGNGTLCPLGAIGAALPPASVTVTASATPSAPGAAVTFKAAVPNGTGTVTFADNGALIGTCQAMALGADFTASCPVTYAVAGSRTIVATYSGDTAAAGASSAPLKHQVGTTTGPPVDPPVDPPTGNASPTSVVVQSSANPSAPGAEVTYTAAITPAPTGGTVSFSDNAASVATCQSLPIDASGKAICSVTYTELATHSIVATYSGSTTHAGSTSSAFEQTMATTGEPPLPNSPAFTPVVPERILDTRPGGSQLGYVGSKPSAGQTVVLQVTGAGETKVPANAGAVILNVTGTEATDDGFVTVWPCDSPMPVASNLNLTSGGTLPNLVAVKLSDVGSVCLFTYAGTHLIADIAGWFPKGKTFTPVTPERLLDTRSSTKPAPGEVVTLKVVDAGTAKVPAEAGAVMLNVTGTQATGNGFVTVWPCDSPMPVASNLNLVAGATTPNLVAVKLSASGTVCLFTHSGTHLIADLGGWFPKGPGFTPVTPERLLDTRSQLGYSGDKPVAGQTLTVQVGGVGNAAVPPSATGVFLNVTGTEATGDGFVTVWPCDTTRPTVSNLNLLTGATMPNLVAVKLSAAGTVCVFVQPGTHLIADISGYFS